MSAVIAPAPANRILVREARLELSVRQRPLPPNDPVRAMFFSLLVVTFAIALLVSFVVDTLFSKSIRRFLERVVTPDLASAWHRHLVFALYVVGVSGGVRLYSPEQYINPHDPKAAPLVLNAGRWTLRLPATDRSPTPERP